MKIPKLLNLPNLQLCADVRVSKSWCKQNSINIEKIKEDLTVIHNDLSSVIYRENDAFLRVPRYYGLKKWAHHKEFSILLTPGNEIPTRNALFTATLDEKSRRQITSTKQCLVKFFEHRSRGCVLRMPCGFGKTVCALFLISQRRRRTLYIVQADHLFQQTIASIQRLMPHAQIGTIRGPTSTWKTDADIVVAMMQTLFVHRDILKTPLTWSFGFVVVDECHHVSAPTFWTVLQRFAPAYFLGLTATPSRIDGRTKWIEWMLGPTVDVFCENELKRSDIEVVWSEPLSTSFQETHLVNILKPNSEKTPKYPNTIWLNLLVWDMKRRDGHVRHIFDQVLSQLQWTNPHEPQVVVFAARIFQLCLLSYQLQKQYVRSKIRDYFYNDVPDEICETMQKYVFYHEDLDYWSQEPCADHITTLADYYRFSRNKRRADDVADTQASYLQYVQQLDENHPWMFPMCLATTTTRKPYANMNRVVLFATVQKLGEGVDITTLHTVCLTSSLSAQNLSRFEQVIGRLRKKQGTKKRIIDFTDTLFANQTRQRKKFYEKRGLQQRFMSNTFSLS